MQCQDRQWFLLSIQWPAASPITCASMLGDTVPAQLVYYKCIQVPISSHLNYS